MGDIAVGVSERPGGEGVSRESLVHHRNRGGGFRGLEVEVVLPDLVREEETLIDHGPGAHRGDEVLVPVLQVQSLDAVGGFLADDVEFPLQGVLHHHVRAAADEDLTDHRGSRPHGVTHLHMVIDRDIAPAENDLALRLHDTLNLRLARRAARGLLREEDHADTVVTGGRERHALLRELLSVIAIGDLNQDTGTVAAEGVRPDRAAVIQVMQDEERVLNHLMRDAALDIRDETNAAGVVLCLRCVQSVLGGIFPRFFQSHLRHDWSLPKVFLFYVRKLGAHSFTCAVHGVLLKCVSENNASINGLFSIENGAFSRVTHI